MIKTFNQKNGYLMKQLIFLLLLSFSFSIHAQSIVGEWQTFDDTTKEKKAVIEIYKKNQHYFAKIVNTVNGKTNAVCTECKDDKKGKPILGLVIIENMKNNGKKYDGGTILDPESGETYNCQLELIHIKKLKVRGYFGFSLFGRTQYWFRKE